MYNLKHNRLVPRLGFSLRNFLTLRHSETEFDSDFCLCNNLQWKPRSRWHWFRLHLGLPGLGPNKVAKYPWVWSIVSMYAMICTQLHLKIKHCKSGNFKLYFITPGRCQEYWDTLLQQSLTQSEYSESSVANYVVIRILHIHLVEGS